MVRVEHPDSLIPPEHAEALRAIDLRLYFGIHGGRIDLPDYGPAVLTVTDDEYEQGAQMVADLNLGRGDVLAGESVAFDGDWHPMPFLNGMRSLVRQSAWIDGSKFNVVGNSLQETPSADAIILSQFSHVNPTDLVALAQETRRFRVLRPTEYADALAVAKGVPCPHADASAEEMREWREYKAEEQQRAGFIGNLVTSESLWGEAEIRFRDKRMVARLGAIASEINPKNRDDPPHLAFQAGEGRRRGVTRILTANEIPFTQHALTPNFTRWQIAHSTRIWASVLTPFVKSVREKDIENWLANARSASRVSE